jgi:hypothetical protein
MTRSFLAAGLVCTVLLVQAGWAVAADEKKQRKKKPQQTSLQAAKADRQRSKAATTAATAAVAAAVVAPRAVARPAPAVRDGETEARLIEVYRLIGQARGRDALARAEALVRDHPNFQLAQLVYGDLLASQTRPVRMFGDVPDTTARAGAALLAELRDESQVRIRALRERPPTPLRWMPRARACTCSRTHRRACAWWPTITPR